MEKQGCHMAILHAHNTYNNGSFMMLLNFLHYFDKSLPDNTKLTAWVELDGADNEKRLADAFGQTGLQHIEWRTLPFKITSQDNSSFLIRLFRLLVKIFVHPRKFKRMGINAVVILGGDDISEYYKKWMVVADLARIRRYSNHFTTILAGQTIGPFRGLREKIAGFCLSKSLIFTRDNVTRHYLVEKLKVAPGNIYQAADLAFAALPVRNTGIGLCCDLQKGSYLCIVPGGFYSLYTNNRQAYIVAWARLLDKIKTSKALSGKKIILLPHVTRPEDDRSIIRELKKQFSNTEEFIFIEDELMPDEVRNVLGGSLFTITARMHAAISTFQAGIPAIAIGFSVKYGAIIGAMLQCPELVVNSSDNLFKNPAEFEKEVMDRVGYLLENYGLLTGRIGNIMPGLKNMAAMQVEAIAKIVCNPD